jgi:hypothetical protein
MCFAGVKKKMTLPDLQWRNGSAASTNPHYNRFTHQSALCVHLGLRAVIVLAR